MALSLSANKNQLLYANNFKYFKLSSLTVHETITRHPFIFNYANSSVILGI
jgi:hypothetical protein